MNLELIIERLYERQIIKNYKELCEVLEIKPCAGNSKKSQLKELDTYCNYHKEGNKFIIDEIFDIQKEKEDLRKFNGGDNNKGNFKKYAQLKIKDEDFNNRGIYYILNKDTKEIYIGSTANGFRGRFQEHNYGSSDDMEHTYNLLHNGGEFYILYDMTGIEDIELIRMVENEFIQYFKDYTDYNVINKMNEVIWKGKNYKQKYKNIKVKSEDYNLALDILRNNGFDI